jgi:uncharacterized protein (TIGR00162 family)
MFRLTFNGKTYLIQIRLSKLTISVETLTTVHMIEKPQLRYPILVEGLPGIGFVANIACLHLIRELKAKRFCSIYSPHFQVMALTNDHGRLRPLINELYAAQVPSLDHDIIILYGNAQAHASKGQYEVCDRILDTVCEMGCRKVITIGGLKREYPVTAPSVYCAATDTQTFEEAAGLGAKVVQGRVFGAAGVLVGLAQIKGMTGLCVLVETLGLYPDAPAARIVLNFLSRYLGLKVDFAQLDAAVQATHELLEGFFPDQQVKKESTALP